MTPQTRSLPTSARGFVERRGSVRVPTNDPAVLHSLNPASPERFEVRILDVSKSGCKLLTDRYFQRGTLVQIRLREWIADGEVRYCVPAKSGFHAGIHILDVFALPETVA